MYSKEDIAILRELARKVADLAADPINDVKRELWKTHTALKPSRPPLFLSPEGSWEEILPSMVRCETPEGKWLERELLMRIVRGDLLKDDTPIVNRIDIPICSVPANLDWGLQMQFTHSADQRGAWRYKEVIEEPEDWKKMRMPELIVDEKAVRERVQGLQEVVGDILDVRMTGCNWFSFHMMNTYCKYRGMTNMMMDLILEPEMVHDVISFFTEGTQRYINQIRDANLIALNNDHTYHYTGGVGYTDELPKAGFDPDHVRFDDVWGAAEAQEFAQVSPEMHEEFILQYERKLLENFGMNGYGCCDDLTNKMEGVMKIKNLRRIGICPWADIEKCADQMGKNYVLTWKPQPSYLANEHFDDDMVHNYLAESLRKSKHGQVEIILRDTHSCRNEPERFARFRKCAYKAIEEVYDCEIPWKND